jgi:pimeloyl-ACP methyl ester carboxylesterase
MFILSQQYGPRGDEPPTESIAKFAGDHFNFALHFQEPGVAEAELDKDPRDTILRVFYSLSGDAPPGTTEYLFTEKPASAGVLEGMPVPDELPAWLTEADLDYFAEAFRHSGFRGGLNWYRNMDSDWKELPEMGATELKQPTSYMGGRKDATLVYAPIFDPMIANFPKLRKIIFVEDAGHWIQMERADEVSEELIRFLKDEFSTGKS